MGKKYKFSEKKTVLIPNATTPINNGDQIMLIQLIKYLKRTSINLNIIVHSSDPNLQKKLDVDKVGYSIDGWIGSTKSNLFIKAIRLLKFAVYLIFRRLNLSSLRGFDKSMMKIIKDYDRADYIVFVGNGGLRSKKGIKEAVLLLFNLLPYYFTKFVNKPVVVTPISFGPFAYKWQAGISAFALKNIKRIYLREKTSFKLAKKYNLYQSKKGFDLALSLAKDKSTKTHSRLLGLTVRNWFENEKQVDFENKIAKGIGRFAKQNDLTVFPIIQVNGINEHSDKSATKRVSRYLKKMGTKIKEQVAITSTDQAIATYSSLNMLVGMRMHSNIIAATQLIPFIAIAYEYKTLGIAETIGMKKWVMDAAEVESEKIFNLLHKANKNKRKIVNNLKKKINYVKSYSNKHWTRLFSTDLKLKTKIVTTPTVTIGIPAYNEEKNIKKLLNSILKQVQLGYELKSILVVTDGSTDNTVSEVRSVKSDLIRLIINKKREGKNARFNQILRNSKTDLLVQIDGDIILANNKVIHNLVYPYLKDNSIDLICGKAIPLTPRTYIERLAFFGYELWDELREKNKTRAARYYCTGAIRAFSSRLVKKLKIPKNFGSAEDVYSFYFAKKNKFRIAIAKDCFVYYKLPDNFKDYFNQMKRFLAANNEIRPHFKNRIIKRYDTIDNKLKIKMLFIKALESPVLAASYVFLHLFPKVISKVNNKSSPVYHIESSKLNLYL